MGKPPLCGTCGGELDGHNHDPNEPGPQCPECHYHFWHFARTCTYCGCSWGSLHCPHDGHQNPCPGCGRRQDVVRETDEAPCECEFDC